MSRLLEAAVALWLGWSVTVAAAGEPPLEIRTISQEGYTGKFNVANPAKPGMMVEVMHAIEQLDPTVRFSGLEVQASVKRIEHELEYGGVDVFFGLSKSDSRVAKFVFVEPALYQASYQFAVRADDSAAITSMDDFQVASNEGVVLANSSESNLDYLRAHNLTIDASGTNTVVNCKKLIAGRGRYYFASTISLVEEIKAQKWTGTIRLLQPRFLTANVYALFSRQAPSAMVERVRAGLVSLERSGVLSRIFHKYGSVEQVASAR